MSERDIAAGERWSTEIENQLRQSGFGVICLTPENSDSRWLNFEAGALSNAVSSGAVCPYLLDLNFADLSGPLTMFQAKKADKETTWELVAAINDRSERQLDVAVLMQTFEALWDRLEQRLEAIPPHKEPKAKSRTQAQILEELVSRVRGLESLIKKSAAFRESRPLKQSITVKSDDSVAGIDPSVEVEFRPSIGNLVDHVAGAFGLNLDQYGKEWYLRHGPSDRILSPQDAQDLPRFLGRSNPEFILTSVPF